jgi:hypothetical protein
VLLLPELVYSLRAGLLFLACYIVQYAAAAADFVLPAVPAATGKSVLL